MAGEGEGSPPSVYSVADPAWLRLVSLATELGHWSPKRHSALGLSLQRSSSPLCLSDVSVSRVSV